MFLRKYVYIALYLKEESMSSISERRMCVALRKKGGCACVGVYFWERTVCVCVWCVCKGSRGTTSCH